MRLGSIVAAGIFVAAAYVTVMQAATAGPWDQWRAGYEASLKAPDGWLSVAGLIWLHDGANTIPLPNRKTALVTFGNGKAVYENKLLKPDTTGHPDVLKFGDVAVTVIERGERTGVRVRDPNAETRRNFTGCKWFPGSEAWRVEARWVAYAKPKSIAITNVLGMTDQEPSPGYAEFTVRGKQLRLEPVVEAGELFFMFKDATSGKSTYGAGRFLYAVLPEGNTVELDFNKATNPPCAFTAFATCPLPPRQNILPVAIEAGEKSYANH
ncbi:MAG: DUF1684 domain-containing protein [Acidobacteriota bacterium]|nr:DUF1684 domain-containing protein [Acidobacteriota bacterium]